MVSPSDLRQGSPEVRQAHSTSHGTQEDEDEDEDEDVSP